jgi:serine kinase of HPr protein (carbohydrate metabolism regulator)
VIRHAGLIARRVDGDWRGVLIEGPSGIGKSDLALRALDQGFSLVADDRVILFASGGVLWGRAPESLAGLIEVRGLGVTARSYRALCRVSLLIRCVAGPEAVERLPDPRDETLAGVALPSFDLWPLEPAAPAKIRHMIEHLGVVG